MYVDSSLVDGKLTFPFSQITVFLGMQVRVWLESLWKVGKT